MFPISEKKKLEAVESFLLAKLAVAIPSMHLVNQRSKIILYLQNIEEEVSLLEEEMRFAEDHRYTSVT